MKSLRARKTAHHQQPVRQPAKTVTKEPARTVKSAAKPVSDRRMARKMEEEPREIEQYETDESSYDEPEQEDLQMDTEEERDDLKEKVAENTLKDARIDADLMQTMKKRYNELIKQLWENQGKLDDFGFSPEEKDLLNERESLFLEYFVCNAIFRDDKVNLFEFIDTFMDTVKFV